MTSNICVDICVCVCIYTHVYAPWVFLWNNHLDLDFVFLMYVFGKNGF